MHTFPVHHIRSHHVPVHHVPVHHVQHWTLTPSLRPCMRVSEAPAWAYLSGAGHSRRFGEKPA